MNSLFRFRRINGKGNSLENQSNQYLEAAFQASNDGLIVYDKESQEVITINKTISRIFELPEGMDLKGLNINRFMMRYLSGESPNFTKLLNELNENWTGEGLFTTHQKNTFYGLVNTNILSLDSESRFRILSITDISASKKFQRDILAANEKVEMASKSKFRFLSTISHELRTPLNGIIGTSYLILSKTNLPAEVNKNIEVIKYSSQHMLEIVNNILDFSKMDECKMALNEKPFNLFNCLNNITGSFQNLFNEQNIKLITNFPSVELENPEIISDEIKLSQTIKNLLSNALKFTNCGEVVLSVKIVEKSESSLLLNFEVKDTGIGIPHNKLKDIFEAFEQVYNDDLKRKYQGSGLGLTISSELVRMLGGTIEVESIVGKGSRFFFTISLKRFIQKLSDSEIREVNPEWEKKDIKGIRALIVEDNEINASILRSFLKKWQLSIKEAATGVHALELLKYHKFDIILMDLEMPEMNGYTTLRKIQELKIDVPVIAFTATLLDDMNSLITESGFTDYINKPFKPADLKRKIQKYCERKIDYV